MKSIPDDLLRKVLGYLPFKELLDVRCTCRQFNSIAPSVKSILVIRRAEDIPPPKLHLHTIHELRIQGSFAFEARPEDVWNPLKSVFVRIRNTVRVLQIVNVRTRNYLQNLEEIGCLPKLESLILVLDSAKPVLTLYKRCPNLRHLSWTTNYRGCFNTNILLDFQEYNPKLTDLHIKNTNENIRILYCSWKDLGSKNTNSPRVKRLKKETIHHLMNTRHRVEPLSQNGTDFRATNC